MLINNLKSITRENSKDRKNLREDLLPHLLILKVLGV